MEQYVIIKTVCQQRIVLIVGPECLPIVIKLFRTKHKDIPVAAFVILYDSKGRICLSKSDTISKNTAIVFFQFIDDSQSRIPLEIVQFIPYYAVLEPCRFIRQNIFIDIIKELIEDIV